MTCRSSLRSVCYLDGYLAEEVVGLADCLRRLGEEVELAEYQELDLLLRDAEEQDQPVRMIKLQKEKRKREKSMSIRN